MKNFLLITFIFLLSGCVTTKYIEKQSVPARQAVFAAGDSMLEGRVDLAEYYIFELEKLFTPPESKDRIVIKPLYKNR